MNDTYTYIKDKYGDVKYNQFMDYLDLLLEWNNKMNLTAITDRDDIVLKHFIDSLIMPDILGIKDEEFSIIDIGPGAGFPSIPLRIILDKPRFTLVDSLAKRLSFLQVVIDKLGLKNIELRHDRCEDVARDTLLREQYDIATARAVANLSTLSEYCLPFVKQGGRFIAYKSADIEEEKRLSEKGIKKLGGKISDIKYYTLPYSDLGRSLVVVDKLSTTPSLYPRKAGIPAKKPL